MLPKTRREFLRDAGTAAASMGALAAGQSACNTIQEKGTTMDTSLKKPNFIIFLTDDQGYGDLSCMGAPDLRTPHLDRIAESGVRFTDWYSNSPVCSPSRASLLTGRYPGNAGVRSILAGHRTASGLPIETPTLATALKQLGYKTGLCGKWHLGAAEACRPHRHGFDTWFGFLAGCIDYYSHIFYWGMANGKEDPVHDLWSDNTEVYVNGQYFTELITEHATAFIREAASGPQPFFLYVAYNAPHYPMHAPEAYMRRFAHLPWPRQVMAAMIGAVDDSVGAIMTELDNAGLYDNTCVFFQSDNGPSRETRNWLDGCREPYYGGSALPLKGHKFSLYEGGIRVPGLLAWPARIPGGQVLHAPAAAMDVFPTFLRAAGAPATGGDPPGYELDGVDLLPMVTQRAPMPQRDLFWEMGEQTAIRRGPWKLVLNGQLVEGAPPEDKIHLANLDADMAEQTNLKDQHPELVEELRTAAQHWRDGIEERWSTVWLPRVSSTTDLRNG